MDILLKYKLWIFIVLIVIIAYYLNKQNTNLEEDDEEEDIKTLTFSLYSNCTLDDDIFITNKANSMFISQFEAEELQQLTKIEAATYFVEKFGLASNYVKLNMHEHHSNPKLDYWTHVDDNKYKVQDIGFTVNMKDDGFATFGLYLFGPYAIKYTTDTLQYLNKPYTCSLKMMRGLNQESFGNKGKCQGIIGRNDDKVTIKNILTF